jgi:SAM-dependent methyltransferase
LPFPDGDFDAVYHSHVLEHFPREGALRFLREAVRVLRPGGIMRVVVPDLEQIARVYLDKLVQGDEADHEWMLLEMYDQTVRTSSGGAMKMWLQSPPNGPFVRARIGAEADAVQQPRSLWQAIRARSPMDLARLARRQVARGVVRVVGGADALAALDEGGFRRSGEVHQWMYDALSLRRLLEQAGAGEVRRVDAFTSRIPDFARYHLDAADGVVRKPDSLFMEAARLPG